MTDAKSNVCGRSPLARTENLRNAIAQELLAAHERNWNRAVDAGALVGIKVTPEQRLARDFIAEADRLIHEQVLVDASQVVLKRLEYARMDADEREFNAGMSAARRFREDFPANAFDVRYVSATECVANTRADNDAIERSFRNDTRAVPDAPVGMTTIRSANGYFFATPDFAAKYYAQRAAETRPLEQALGYGAADFQAVHDLSASVGDPLAKQCGPRDPDGRID